MKGIKRDFTAYKFYISCVFINFHLDLCNLTCLSQKLLRDNPDKKYKIMGQDDFVQPALKGVLNVLKSCSRAKSVRRVVYTSSVAAACPLTEEGELITGSTLDESNWTPVEFMRRKAGLIVYVYTV